MKQERELLEKLRSIETYRTVWPEKVLDTELKRCITLAELLQAR